MFTCAGETPAAPETAKTWAGASVAGQPSSIHFSMKMMSEAETRCPPHISGGNCVPSNGNSPLRPLMRPEAAPRPLHGFGPPPTLLGDSPPPPAIPPPPPHPRPGAAPPPTLLGDSPPPPAIPPPPQHECPPPSGGGCGVGGDVG